MTRVLLHRSAEMQRYFFLVGTRNCNYYLCRFAWLGVMYSVFCILYRPISYVFHKQSNDSALCGYVN
jgi:hypothetical protein